MRVCVAQMAVTRDIQANLGTILGAIEHARREGAEVLLTPEGSLSGYTSSFVREKLEAALTRVTSAARDAGIALALGTCYVEPDDGVCYDELRFYSRSGEFLGFHAKILLCGTLGECPEGEITEYGTRPLRTFELDGVRVGGLICNDLWANPECTPMDDPHLTQQLSRMGARIIFHAANGGRNGGEWSRVAWRYHESNLRLRARASHVWIVTVDSAHPIQLPCSAPSGVLDPDGNWIVTADPQGERFVTADIDL